MSHKPLVASGSLLFVVTPAACSRCNSAGNGPITSKRGSISTLL
jgi:hypothetical protein